MYVCTVCTDLLFESYKTVWKGKSECLKGGVHLLDPVPEMFCVTTKLHMTFYQDECEKVMTGFVCFFLVLENGFAFDT